MSDLTIGQIVRLWTYYACLDHEQASIIARRICTIAISECNIEPLLFLTETQDALRRAGR